MTSRWQVAIAEALINSSDQDKIQIRELEQMIESHDQGATKVSNWQACILSGACVLTGRLGLQGWGSLHWGFGVKIWASDMHGSSLGLP